MTAADPRVGVDVEDRSDWSGTSRGLARGLAVDHDAHAAMVAGLPVTGLLCAFAGIGVPR